MKNYFLFLFCILISTTSVQAQTEFALIGAEWCYGSTGTFNYPHYAKYIVVKDTVINGESCRKVEGTYYSGNPGIAQDDPVYEPTAVQYVHTSGDTVFYYNSFYSSFLPLYIFNVQQGDTVVFQAPLVDSGLGLTDTFFRVSILNIDTLIVDGIPLRRVWTQALDNWRFWPEYYIERIGSAFYMGGHSLLSKIPKLAERSLRRYNDQDISYKHDSTDCEYLPVNIKDFANSEGGAIDIYPNPNRGVFFINNKNGFKLSEIQVWNSHGRMVTADVGVLKSAEIVKCEFDLAPGIYILKLMDKAGKVYFQKISVIQ